MFFESMAVSKVRFALIESSGFFNFKFSDQDCSSGIVMLFSVENRGSLVSLTELRGVNIGFNFMIVLPV